MKARITIIGIALLGQFMMAKAQSTDSLWTVQRCITRALDQNIQVQKSSLTNQATQLTVEQAKASVFPTVSASVGQNFGWSKTQTSASELGSYDGTNSTSIGVNSSVKLYNGFKIRNNIKQAQLAYEAGKYDVETTKESISLSVLEAYLQVLYAEEQVKNSTNQVVSTSEQLRLAEERQRLGSISKAEYLQVKSQLASEKSTLAISEKTLAINKVTLVQLLELPASTSMNLLHPDFSGLINQNRTVIADSIYAKALAIKPQIKSAGLNVQSAQLDVDVAKADYQPSLSMSAGLSTSYSSSYDAMSYGYQLQNKVTPTVGLSLSIPIYQNRQIKTQVAKAKIGIKTAELTETGTKNELRKAIEQACVNVESAEKAYDASREGFDAAQESFEVAREKFNNGMLNPVDFLVQKTNLINAESSLLQSKYNLILSYKNLDFYSGQSLDL